MLHHDRGKRTEFAFFDGGKDLPLGLRHTGLGYISASFGSNSSARCSRAFLSTTMASGRCVGSICGLLMLLALGKARGS